jgi:hypothetical protein
MDADRRPRRGSFGFAVVLIVLGLLFLISNLARGFDPWPVVLRYWPLLLILLGLGQLFDHMRTRDNPQVRSTGWISGTAIGVVILIVLFGVSISKSGASNPILHESQNVDPQGAKSVAAIIDMPAGQLTMSGGSSHLVDADFRFDQNSGKPTIDYTNASDSGRLNISQPRDRGPHFGRNENDWDLHLGNVAWDLQIEMGAGHGDLNLHGLDLTHLKMDMGAGQLDLNLTGDWKQNFDAEIQGGVGQATIHLPRNVGVEVRAQGGIGSIDFVGLHHSGDRYVNDAFGKSPITIHLNVQGGIGQIELIEEP